jgi:ketosteroid isomerase-like protein
MDYRLFGLKRRAKEHAMDEEVEVVLAALRAVEERDREALLALLHEDVEFHDAGSLPYGGAVRGEDDVGDESRPAGTTWLGTWGPLQPTPAERRMEPRIVASNGGEVVVEYRHRAVSPAGERVDLPVLALYEVRDGKLARAQMFHFDTAALTGFLERARGNRFTGRAPL